MTALAVTGRIFKGRPLASLGLAWLCLVVLAAVFAPLIVPYDPLEIDPVVRLTPPGAEHLFGTDHFGRDTFSRSIYGARMAIVIGIGSVFVALVAGGLTGMLSAYFTPVAYIPNHSVSFLCIEPVPEALVHSLSVAAMSDREVITALREAKQIAKPMKIDRYMRRLIDAVKANPGVRKAFQMTEKP